MREQCQTSIYSYANLDMQQNAAITGEHKNYVLLVLQILRDNYRDQVMAGKTEFIIPEDTKAFLDSQKPWA